MFYIVYAEKKHMIDVSTKFETVLKLFLQHFVVCGLYVGTALVLYTGQAKTSAVQGKHLVPGGLKGCYWWEV
jgi:hypothetical protein